MSISNQKPLMKPAALRGILKYVLRFQGHIFVIALDSDIIGDKNLPNILTDIAVLNSLRIKIVLVHGISTQMQQIAGKQKLSDIYGEGATDATTLNIAVKASHHVLHELMQRLTQSGLQYAYTNAVRGAQVGIVRGKDQLFSGKVEKIDEPFIQKLLDDNVLPIFSPIVPDRRGQTLRLNADSLSAELARRLSASKLIYLTAQPGLCIRGEKISSLTLEEIARTLRTRPQYLDERARSKARYALDLLSSGATPRAHVLDGRILGGLITEIFDAVGTGTMIHANEYQQIRPARKKDIPALYAIIRNAAKTETLRTHTRQTIEKAIDTFYVHEIDGSLIACVSLQSFSRSKTIELASLYVQPFYQGRDIGSKMVAFACQEAARRGFLKIVAATTQSFDFFQETCGFTEGSVKDLPRARRIEYEKSGRRSRILIKRLKSTKT